MSTHTRKLLEALGVKVVSYATLRQNPRTALGFNEVIDLKALRALHDRIPKVGQRSLSKAHSASVQEFLKRDYDALTGQVAYLYLDCNSELRDGQHRVEAALAIGRPLRNTYVVLDTPEAVLSAIDLHRPRSLGDKVRVRKLPGHTAAAASFILAVENGQDITDVEKAGPDKFMDSVYDANPWLTDLNVSLTAKAAKPFQQGFLYMLEALVEMNPKARKAYDMLMSDLSKNHHMLGNDSVLRKFSECMDERDGCIAMLPGGSKKNVWRLAQCYVWNCYYDGRPNQRVQMQISDELDENGDKRPPTVNRELISETPYPKGWKFGVLKK